jgi:hypothetical protein
MSGSGVLSVITLETAQLRKQYFWKEKKKVSFSFSETFILNFYPTRKNSARSSKIIRYFFQSIWTKLGFCRQISNKSTHHQFLVQFFQWERNCSMRTNRHMTRVLVAVRNFMEATESTVYAQLFYINVVPFRTIAIGIYTLLFLLSRTQSIPWSHFVRIL